MSYQVSCHRLIQKQLDQIPDRVFEKVQGRIEQLKHDPFKTQQVKKLTGRDGYSLRIGEYRLLFEIDTKRKEIRIIAIRHRREVYR